MENYPLATDQELLSHYMYGGAGPFIDLLVYVDLGVGFNLKPVDFKDEEDGLEAVQVIEDEFHRRDFNATMMQFATYYLVLGRACLVKTYDGGGDFYFDDKSCVTGLDCINPMTLNVNSVREVMEDTTGTKEFVQQVKGLMSSYSQDRVIYRANNPFNKFSVLGVSNLQRCVSDLRLLSRFPGYRDNLARKYSNLHRIFEVKTDEFGKTERGKSILNNPAATQSYLNEVRSHYSIQEEEGNSLFLYDWVDVKESSYAGKEVKLNDLEVQTLRNIAFKLDVPLDLLMYSQLVNRSVMEVLADVFVNKQKAGTCNYVFKPLIEDVANEILHQHEIVDGYVEMEFNPFLSKDLEKVASILKDLWPTGSLTHNEVRNELNLPPLKEGLEEEE
jgi:hypothetical protein